MDMKELFEEIYFEVLFDNVDYKRLAHEGNELVGVLTKYPEFEKTFEADNGKELLVQNEMTRYLLNTADVFITAHKVRTKQDKNLIFKGLKKQFERVEKKFRKTNKEYLSELDIYENADKKFMEVIKEEDKKIYCKLSDTEGDRFLLEIEIMFRVMKIVSKFLLGINKLKGFENNINDAGQQSNN